MTTVWWSSKYVRRSPPVQLTKDDMECRLLKKAISFVRGSDQSEEYNIYHIYKHCFKNVAS